MKPRTRKTVIFVSLFLFISLLASADRRGAIYNLAVELERRATELALNNFEHFKGWSGVISDEEQAVLFKSEAFSASSRPVYLIEKGKRRGITSPQVLMRFGGWSKVYEVPSEIIDTYPEGEPVY